MGWNLNDLTIATDSPQALGEPTGYVFGDYGTQHVTYVGVDNHVHELLWDSLGWHHNDLTNAAGMGAIPAGNTAIGYVFFCCSQHVIYFGEGINELWWDSSGWHHNELLSAAGVTRIEYTGRPIGYAFTAQGTQHVNFPDSFGNVQELW